MTKTEFLEILRQKLSRIPSEDAERSIAYYGEMLDDRMEDGMSEEEAVGAMGEPDEIASQIVADLPTGRIVKEKMRVKRKMRAWEIVLLVLGSPIWLSLLVAALAVVLSLLMALFAVLITVIATLWAVGAVFVGCALGGIFMAVNMFCQGFGAQGLCFIGAGLVLAGFSVLMYFASLYSTIGCGKFVKTMFFHGKHSLTKGEKNHA